MRSFEYWASGEGLAHITPPRAPTPEPEGFDDLIRAWTAGRLTLDFGCGIGRIAHLFDLALYRGVDICDAALGRARQRCPGYRFDLVDADGVLPRADVVFAHNVLLHIPDDLLTAVVARFAGAAVIVSEILGRTWRRPGLPPVFNRDADDYAAALAPRRLIRSATLPCAHYRNTDLTIMEFAA